MLINTVFTGFSFSIFTTWNARKSLKKTVLIAKMQVKIIVLLHWYFPCYGDRPIKSHGRWKATAFIYMAFMLVKLFLFPVFRHKTRPAHRKYSPKEAALAPHRQNSAHHRPTRLLRPVYSASMRYDREMRHPQPEFSPPGLNISRSSDKKCAFCASVKWCRA